MNRELGLVSPASYLSTSNWLFEQNAVTKWTPEENKRFENALALFDKDTPDRWQNVASMIPGKTVTDVIKQYWELVEDVSDIEAGLIPIPGYANNSFTLEWMNSHGFGDGFKQIYSPGEKRSSSARCGDHERKKGIPWTEEEHRQFLLGLKKYGKGIGETSPAISSRRVHQLRLLAMLEVLHQAAFRGKDKRRSSIHDITTVNLDETKSPSPDKDMPHSPEKPSLIVQTQQGFDTDVVVRATFDSELTNQGGIMGFSPENSSLMMSHLQGPSSYGLNLQENHHFQSFDPQGFRLGHHGTIFQMHH